MTFGELVRKRRSEAKLNRYLLEKRSGVDRRVIRRVEEGKGCLLKTAASLLEALGVQSIKVAELRG